MSEVDELVNRDVQPSVTGLPGLIASTHLASASLQSGTPVHSPVSVVICAYTEARYSDLFEAIESVRSQTAPVYEVIVVVDHNPHLLSRLRGCCPGVTLIENAHSQGLSGARNTGLAAACGEIVAFLDDDAVADTYWLQRLLEGFAHQQVLGVGGFIEPIWDASRPAWLPEEFLWVVGCSYRGMPVTPAPVRNLIGCNMAFRRQVCLDLGGFSSNFGHAGGRPYGDEETEFCIRMRHQRPESMLLYIPQARVRHHVPAARLRWRYFRERCALEGASKAMLATVVGAHDGLATERAYIQRVLPMGVLRGIAESVTQRDLGGIARSAVIIAGLGLTMWAFLSACVARHLRRPSRDQAATARAVMAAPEATLALNDSGAGQRRGRRTPPAPRLRSDVRERNTPLDRTT